MVGTSPVVLSSNHCSQIKSATLSIKQTLQVEKTQGLNPDKQVARPRWCRLWPCFPSHQKAQLREHCSQLLRREERQQALSSSPPLPSKLCVWSQSWASRSLLPEGKPGPATWHRNTVVLSGASIFRSLVITLTDSCG